MNPVTHFLVSWGVANTAALERRDRAIVALAGIAPDLDGLGAIPELLTRNSAHPLDWFSRYHHVMGHNAGFALVVTGASLLFGTRRWKTAALACVTFHVHLLCDVVGARGPDGDQWPIPYLLPFSHAWQWTWQGQWPLNAWQNFTITGVALALMFYLAWTRGYSPLEMISRRADMVFVGALRNRFEAAKA
ncbi:MAG TPA: metal-dependent hydrolase [Terriglobales bacterium]|nr:metal-dependent hydrolase [Terriglobales bacterium]